ncbi:MAG TPA: hypothetical protein VGG69_04590 [Rhizomicrobium sp.]
MAEKLPVVVASVVFGIAASLAFAADRASPPAYSIAKYVSLGAPEKWDFVRYDPSSDRAYVSHRTKVDVVDVGQGKIVGEVPDIGESHDVAIVPSLNRGYADDAAAQRVIVFDLKTLSKIATVPVGVDADAMAFDPATSRVFVMNADGNSVTAIDAVKNAALRTVPLGGAPEMAVADGAGKLFINIASTNEVVAFDTHSLAIQARWPVAACEKPHGLAMDPHTRRLFVTCANARMLVLDAENGKVLANLGIGRGTDGAAFDPVRKLAFSSNGDSTLSVVAERNPGTFESLGDIKTVPGARTMSLDPRSGRIFLVSGIAAKIEPPATPAEHPHITYAPNSARLLILERPR